MVRSACNGGSMDRATNHVLVVRGGAIGDFILTLPVLAALRATFPAARVEILGYPHVGALAVAGGLADAVHSIESAAFATLFVADGAVPEFVAEFFARFDLIVAYVHDPGRVFEQNVTRLSQASYLRGPHRPDEERTVHATAVFLAPLKARGIVTPDPVPRLKIPLSPDRRPMTRGSPLLAIHPGSGSARKNWPEQSWARLLEELTRQTDWRLLLIGGEAEGDRLARLARCWSAARLDLAQSLPLVELARSLQCCAAFVGHDSGITHLAAALGLRTLVLWGNTSPEIWRPLGERVKLLRDQRGLGELEVGIVLEECKRLVPESQHRSHLRSASPEI